MLDIIEPSRNVVKISKNFVEKGMKPKNCASEPCFSLSDAVITPEEGKKLKNELPAEDYKKLERLVGADGRGLLRRRAEFLAGRWNSFNSGLLAGALEFFSFRLAPRDILWAMRRSLALDLLFFAGSKEDTLPILKPAILSAVRSNMEPNFRIYMLSWLVSHFPNGDEDVARAFTDVAKDRAFNVALSSIRALIWMAVPDCRTEGLLNSFMKDMAWSPDIRKEDVEKELPSALGLYLIETFDVRGSFIDDIGCSSYSRTLSGATIKEVTQNSVTVNFKETFKCSENAKSWHYDNFARVENTGEASTTVRSLATGKEKTFRFKVDNTKAYDFVSFCARTIKKIDAPCIPKPVALSYKFR